MLGNLDRNQSPRFGGVYSYALKPPLLGEKIRHMNVLDHFEQQQQI
jgi:hypothetical protein